MRRSVRTGTGTGTCHSGSTGRTRLRLKPPIEERALEHVPAVGELHKPRVRLRIDQRDGQSVIAHHIRQCATDHATAAHTAQSGTGLAANTDTVVSTGELLVARLCTGLAIARLSTALGAGGVTTAPRAGLRARDTAVSTGVSALIVDTAMATDGRARRTGHCAVVRSGALVTAQQRTPTARLTGRMTRRTAVTVAVATEAGARVATWQHSTARGLA
jgi:hypothetical protein